MVISKILAEWYSSNKRQLPWRDTKNPYKIWVSEIILQQTRVAQGMDYYHSFINAFPDIASLANSDPDEVLRAWQGLGYYSRARNMHHAAKDIMQSHNGNFPEKYDDIIKLKGIGRYTASAIASLAFNHPVAAVDGNVIRVISRLFALSGKKNSSSYINKIESLALSLLDKNNPGQHNQAVIELGALVCRPVNPACAYCPLKSNCKAFLSNMVLEFPERYSKKTSRKRFFYYYYILWEDYLYINKRTGKDIWNSLYELPLHETLEPLQELQIIDVLFSHWHFNPHEITINEISAKIKHILSHQTIIAQFIMAESQQKPNNTHWLEINKDETNKYAFPVLIANYFTQVSVRKKSGSRLTQK